MNYNNFRLVKNRNDLENAIQVIQSIRGMYDLTGLEVLEGIEHKMTLEEFMDTAIRITEMHTDEEIDRELQRLGIVFKQ